LRDYRRANNLCFRCGEKYEPSHVCAKKPTAELHALTAEEISTELSEHTLELLELQDIAEATHLSVSLKAMAGSAEGGTIRLSATVHNKAMITLVDSGSSHSFINESFLSVFPSKLQQFPPMLSKWLMARSCIAIRW
jgi:hypothetical protein